MDSDWLPIYIVIYAFAILAFAAAAVGQPVKRISLVGVGLCLWSIVAMLKTIEQLS